MNVACMPSDVFSSLFYQDNKTAFDFGRKYGHHALVDELQVGKKKRSQRCKHLFCAALLLHATSTDTASPSLPRRHDPTHKLPQLP